VLVDDFLANVSDRAIDGWGSVCWQGTAVGHGGIATANYGSPELREELKAGQGLELLAPPKRRGREAEVGWTKWLTQKRRRIERVIGQLVERYRAKRTWARDLWHLLTRIYRKVLSHTVAVYLNVQRGEEPLQFDKLLAHWKLAHRVSYCLYLEGW